MMQTTAGRLIGLILALPLSAGAAQKMFRAGAAAIDVSPPKLPVLVSGMFLSRSAAKVTDPVYARAVVLDDGATRLAIVVVDSCMMPRELLDAAKEMASRRTGIPAERTLISATHTHSAPSAMGVLGTPADEEYVKFLPGRIAEAIERAVSRLAPARIGWAAVNDYEHTHCRRWIYAPDKMLTDPFGGRTVRANMHPGYQNPNAIAPSGPVDPELSVLSIQSLDGRPVALLANYSMHYFGSTPVSADYFGLFTGNIRRRIGADENFAGIMSQGTSGDQMWMDYAKPKSNITLEEYAEGVTNSAYEAYKKVQYQEWVPLAMAETKLSLGRRAPDAQRLAWAREIASRMQGRLPANQQEVYALEAIYLHEQPMRELKLQALRIGGLGITAIPNEVFAITGLKLKAQSPLPATFNIELANGAEGYIPPPEQHYLGGYTTWGARTAALEVRAEPQIVETVLKLLEKVSGDRRRQPVEEQGSYARAVSGSKPVAYWRMSDLAGPQALDSTSNRNHAVYEDGVAFYLPGPESPRFSGSRVNRAAHFAGGRMTASVPRLPSSYTAELWFWNGLPVDARGITGYLFSRGTTDGLAIGGAEGNSGKLIVESLAGSTTIAVKTWHHIAIVRNGPKIMVYLNGNRVPEISGEMPAANAGAALFIGGRHDRWATFEGKIDEVAIYDRALSPAEIAAHYQAAGLQGGQHE